MMMFAKLTTFRIRWN